MEKDTRTKLLLDSIKAADGGNVEYTVQTQSGDTVRGAIEDTFFDDFKVRGQHMTPERKQRIARDNADYIEEIAARQIRIGVGVPTIK